MAGGAHAESGPGDPTGRFASSLQSSERSMWPRYSWPLGSDGDNLDGDRCLALLKGARRGGLIFMRLIGPHQ